MKKYTVIHYTGDNHLEEVVVKYTHVVQGCGETFYEALRTYGLGQEDVSLVFEGWITPMDPNNRATWTLPNSCS